MEKIFVADSYKDFELVGDPFENEKGKRCIKIKRPCPRCSGLGIIVSHVENDQLVPIPVDNGVCYKCGGSKVELKTVRAYTEKEYLQLQKSNERARAKREAAEAAKIQENIERADEFKHNTAIKLGFGEDEKIYIVCGGNTYKIKDQLKAMGARFNMTFKWYFTKEVEVPEGYCLCAISFDDLYDYQAETRWARMKDSAEDIIAAKVASYYKVPETEFYPGVEGERIRNFKVRLESVRGFDGYYGYTNIYTFTADKYVFVWMTSKSDLDIRDGEEVSLTGTIKKFNDYNGIHQTMLSRCIVKEI